MPESGRKGRYSVLDALIGFLADLLARAVFLGLFLLAVIALVVSVAYGWPWWAVVLSALAVVLFLLAFIGSCLPPTARRTQRLRE